MNVLFTSSHTDTFYTGESTARESRVKAKISTYTYIFPKNVSLAKKTKVFFSSSWPIIKGGKLKRRKTDHYVRANDAHHIKTKENG